MSYVLNQGLGDISCWGIDVDKWDVDNQVALVLGDKIANTLIFKVSSSAGALRSLSAKDWVRSLLKSQFFPGLSTQIFSIEEFSSPPAPINKSFARTADSTLPKLGWRSGSAIYVKVQFTAKGDRLLFPWPRLDSDAYVGKGCPKEVSVGLYAVDDVVPLPEGAKSIEESSNRSLFSGGQGSNALLFVLALGVGAGTLYFYRNRPKS